MTNKMEATSTTCSSSPLSSSKPQHLDLLLPSWSSNTTCSFNGQVLSFQGSLGYDGLELFTASQVALERGYVYGLCAPNGSGKTSLVRALPSLPNFPESSAFQMEYLAADDITIAGEEDDVTAATTTAGTSRAYCLARVQRRVQEMEQEIDRLESRLENASTDSTLLESISNQLGELYELKDDLELQAEAKADQMFTALQFGEYADMLFLQLSCGWRYKCQLIGALLTRPDCLIIDEPSFLDAAATAWFVSEIIQLAKSNHTVVVLISHKQALMEDVCDRILYLNPASQNLTVYNCSFSEFQAAHAANVKHAKKTKEKADESHKGATESLGKLQHQLHKREQNCQATRLRMFTDKRWVKGKNKEAKQKADHCAASKVKRLTKAVEDASAKEAELRETYVAPLELQGAEPLGDSESHKPLIELCDVSFGYEGSRDMLLEYVDVQIMGSDKVLVQGQNGQGKSTLAKLLLGQLRPTSGELRRQHANVTAHFHQDALTDLVYRHGHSTAVDFLLTRDPNINLVDARTYLGRFGLKGSLCLRPIRTLSAGQRVRLWLAREFWGDQKPSLLILDEATENLDQETTDSLLTSLDNFSAAILAISHDEHFCANFPATQLWQVGHGRVFKQFQKIE